MADFDRKQTAKQLREIAGLYERGGWSGFVTKAMGGFTHDSDNHPGPATLKHSELMRARRESELTRGDSELAHDLGAALTIIGNLWGYHRKTRYSPPDDPVGRLRLLADSIETFRGESEPTGDGQLSPPDRKPNLPKVDIKQNQVRFGGRCYDVTSDAALLFDCLVKAYPQFIPTSDLFSKPSRVKDSLPNPLKTMVVSKPAKGYKLVLTE